MTLTTQFITMLSMLAGGIYVGAAIDTFERLFSQRNKKSWLEIFRQLFFWLFQAAFIFYILYQANYGELRVYVFVALICGFAAYHALFQGTYLKALELWIKIVTAIVKGVKTAIYRLIIWPIRMLVVILISLLFGVYKILYKGIFIVFLVGFYPIKFVFLIFWRLLPKNLKKNLRQAAGFWVKIKNTMKNWKKIFPKK